MYGGGGLRYYTRYNNNTVKYILLLINNFTSTKAEKHLFYTTKPKARTHKRVYLVISVENEMKILRPHT